MTEFVKIVEVGPRDGLQNEKTPLTLADRKNLILDLMQTGLSSIEVGSCVSAKWVPQMAGTAEVLAGIAPAPGLRLPVLAETGIIEPGAFVEYQDGSVTRLGIVRSTQVEAGMPEVWQTLGVQSHA